MRREGEEERSSGGELKKEKGAERGVVYRVFSSAISPFDYLPCTQRHYGKCAGSVPRRLALLESYTYIYQPYTVSTRAKRIVFASFFMRARYVVQMLRRTRTRREQPSIRCPQCHAVLICLVQIDRVVSPPPHLFSIHDAQNASLYLDR